MELGILVHTDRAFPGVAKQVDQNTGSSTAGKPGRPLLPRESSSAVESMQQKDAGMNSFCTCSHLTQIPRCTCSCSHIHRQPVGLRLQGC